ncbi:hypothetical protein NKR23_g10611 [Pleurostoma richardsiae]|uniref:PLL-like beta propeller domain-containing protein n=1 Tax=Pleurostoma richardsiae TaxID=41990 RepID=A0AA38R9T4_9PEZI|nr:hypothetical protein NKR23_g10611 [Pleurostoma richardsiae]
MTPRWLKSGDSVPDQQGSEVHEPDMQWSRAPDAPNQHAALYSTLEPITSVEAPRAYEDAPEVHNPAPLPYSNLEPVAPEYDTPNKQFAPQLPVEIEPPDRSRGTAGTGRIRKKWLWIGVAIVAAVVIIAVVVGCVVGLVVKHGSKKHASSCRDTVCPQILAAAAQDSSLFVFARDQSNRIQYRAGTGSSWTTEWTSLPGGPFSSQPTAMSWAPSWMNVFTLGSGSSRNVLTLGYQDGEWNSTWVDMLEHSASSVSLCVLDNTLNDPSNASAGVMPGQLEQWVVDASSRQVVHDWWRGDVGNFAAPGAGTAWDASMGGVASSSAPALVCRGDSAETVHNLLIYDTDGALNHREYLLDGGWQDWENWGGSFVADPVVVMVGFERFDFFGIGEDKAMHHLTWINGTGASSSSMESLNGTFQSVPSAALTGLDPVRIDVVALGTDDSIKHRVLVGSSWTDDWEDLDVRGNSAPLVFNYEIVGGSPNITGIAVIGSDNELRFTSWETTTSVTSWAGLGNWTDAGGSLTTEYLEVS